MVIYNMCTEWLFIICVQNGILWNKKHPIFYKKHDLMEPYEIAMQINSF